MRVLSIHADHTRRRARELAGWGILKGVAVLSRLAVWIDGRIGEDADA